jgi:DNA polymerase-3 subunit gamma/tau
VNALIEEGVEPMQILKDVMEYFRNLMMLKICGDRTELVAAIGEDRDRMTVQANRFKLEAMQRVIGRLSEAEADVRWRGNVRFMLESLLVELMISLQPESASAPRSNMVPDSTSQPESRSKPVSDPQSALRQEYRSDSTPAREPASAPTPVSGSASESRPNPAPVTPQKGETGVAAALSPSEWAEVLERVRERKKTLHAFLTAITERREADGMLWLIFKDGYLFHKEQSELPENRKLLEEILTQSLNRPVQIRCLMEDEKKERAPDPVQKAMDLLGPDMVTIKKE